MARKKSGTYDNRKYQNEYHRGLNRIMLSFNPNNPEDVELWKFLQSVKNKTGFIKELINAQMKETRSFLLEIPLIDGYEDKEAIKEAIDGSHNIFTQWAYGYEILIDLVRKKVLSVKSAYFYSPKPPEKAILKLTLP